METNATSAEKSIVDALTFGAKTAKRVAWEDWSFRLVGPLQVAVINDSYGYLKDEHTYTVTVSEVDGMLVPAECECPADRYHEEYDCKHKVALAAVGGPVVLEAARAFPTASKEPTKPVTTMADKLATDGGTARVGETHIDRPRSNTESQPGECEECTNLSDDFPCADCYISGEKDFPEEP